MLKRFDLKAAWANGELKICSELKARLEQIYPNRIGWFKDDPMRAGLVFVYQGKRGRDYALGVNALNRLIQGMKVGKMREAWIIFLRRSGDDDNGAEFVDAAPMEQIQTTFCNQAPLKGDWGHYWWVPIISSEGDDEIPF